MTAPIELVVCSLEAWDDVWRRNQFFVQGLLDRDPRLRVLFVEPPIDPFEAVRRRSLPVLPRLRQVDAGGRLVALRPLKTLPRVAGGLVDRLLLQQVRFAARRSGFAHPTLWVNDLTYAALGSVARWPMLYDVTDDWLLAPASPRELARRRRLEERALRDAAEVVVCSEQLRRTKGETRRVTVVPNAVDVAHFARARPRPADLPAAPVAVYVGTVHAARVDVDLILRLATELPQVSVALVGPDVLDTASRHRLRRAPNIHLLGPRPYADVPAYLQHADVIVVPHVLSAFTESLDPIKAYECLAVPTPTVATPVAGFRGLGAPVRAVESAAFVPAVAGVLAGDEERAGPTAVPSWAERTAEFADALARAGGSGAPR